MNKIEYFYDEVFYKSFGLNDNEINCRIEFQKHIQLIKQQQQHNSQILQLQQQQQQAYLRNQQNEISVEQDRNNILQNQQYNRNRGLVTGNGFPYQNSNTNIH